MCSLLSVILPRCLAVVLAVACLHGPVQAQGASPTLERIRHTGVITLGYRVASVPFSYLDARRQPVGYSIDICRRIVDAVRERVGAGELEVREVAVTSATRIPMLADRAIDLECGVTTHTAERDRFVSFSMTTFVAASRLLVKKDGPVQQLQDLRGRTVVTTLATTSMVFLRAANQAQELDMKILAGQDDVDALRMLRNDQAMAFAMDDVLLRGLVAAAPDGDAYRVCDEALTVEPYGIGLPHGDPAFKQIVDEVIVSMYRSGAMYALYRQWFQQPVPPRGINLRMPQPDWLARLVRNPSDSAEPQDYR
jgi:glutamate/aspartate transport system substrate-binding protein